MFKTRFLQTMCTLIFIAVFQFATVLFAQIEWTKYENNPVLDKGSSGSWDDQWIDSPHVLFDGTTYKMWYSGGGSVTGIAIGYATSNDGITWTKYESNPVLELGGPGDWDEIFIWSPVVLYDGTIYKMWYAGAKSEQGSPIGYATSSDGINWIKYESNPVLKLGSFWDWDRQMLSPDAVIYDGSIYKMWYTGKTGGIISQLGYAESPDGIAWEKYDSNPIVKRGATGTWDDWLVWTSYIIPIDSTYHMWYGGANSSDEKMQLGYANSTDGLNWIKYNDNPISNVKAGSWESQYIAQPSIIKRGNELQMWYAGGETYWAGHIGYATGTFSPPTEVSNRMARNNHKLPKDPVLFDNYPNPFNPETVIGYQLSIASEVELGIYNMLGQKMVTLVSGSQAAGRHSVSWDGMDAQGNSLPSGMYFYQLDVGNFNQAKKMFLIR